MTIKEGFSEEETTKEQTEDIIELEEKDDLISPEMEEEFKNEEYKHMVALFSSGALDYYISKAIAEQNDGVSSVENLTESEENLRLEVFTMPKKHLNRHKDFNIFEYLKDLGADISLMKNNSNNGLILHGVPSKILNNISESQSLQNLGPKAGLKGNDVVDSLDSYEDTSVVPGIVNRGEDVSEQIHFAIVGNDNGTVNIIVGSEEKINEDSKFYKNL